MKRRYLAFFAVLIFVCSILPFTRAVNYGLVNFDDYTYILGHAEETEGLSPSGFCWAWRSIDDAIWMPLARMSYMVDYSISRLTLDQPPFDYNPSRIDTRVCHWHSILVHGMNAVLLFWLLLTCVEVARRRGVVDEEKKSAELSLWTGCVCAAGALIWAMHPFRIEDVVWLASRKDALSMFWELLALTFWLKSSNSRHSGEQRYFLLSNACFILALCAKPTAMTFPALVMLFDVFIFKRFVLRRFAVPLAIMGFFGVFATVAQAAGGATESFGDVVWLHKIANAAAAVGVYISKTFWPSGLCACCINRWPDMPAHLLRGVIVCVPLCGYLIWEIYQRWDGIVDIVRGKTPPCIGATTGRDWLLVCVLFFFFSVGPSLGIIGFGVHSYSDRFMYIPGLAFSILFAVVLFRLRMKWAGAIGTIAFCAILCALGGATWNQCQYWRDDRALYERTLACDSPENTEALYALAQYYYEFPHDVQKSVELIEEACRVKNVSMGEFAEFYITVLCEAGQLEKARETLIRYSDWNEAKLALKKNGDYHLDEQSVQDDLLDDADYVSAMCTVQMYSGEFELALNGVNRLSRKFPNESSSYYLQGLWLALQGRMEEAKKRWALIADSNHAGNYIRYRWLRKGILPGGVAAAQPQP